MDTILIILGLGMVMLGIEQWRPGRVFPKRRLWWWRAIAFNVIQAASVYVGAYSWDPLLAQYRVLNFDYLPTFYGAIIGYVVITFVFYWWHRARHEVSWLWDYLHQIHHSPARLEVIASFYKHPAEILINSVLSSFLLITLLGLSPSAISLAFLLTGIAELFYHWNVRTPYWLGFIIQRPESHCVHHRKNYHTNNYSDLPLWDMLFGTFENPRSQVSDCGFTESRELDLKALFLPRRQFPLSPKGEKRRVS